MAANSIDEVVAVLQNIIEESIQNNSRAGFFAALYYKVTCKVREDIANGNFENGARMEKFDVLFANRYLDAFACWKKKEPLSSCWKIAFDTTKKSSPLLLQHLLLGINAHINLDLGIIAVEMSKTEIFADIQQDFNYINSVISSLTNEVLNEISRVSPLLSLLGLHATNYGSILIQFSVDNARDGAWVFAEELYKLDQESYLLHIAERDKTIAKLANGLVHANGIIRFTLWLVHCFEWKKPARIIKVLYEYKKKHFTFSDPNKKQLPLPEKDG